jgi:hypothetical protein
MLNNIIFDIIEEQSILKTTKTKPIVDAIKNRKKITFYYSGPRKPKKDSVKPGYRVKAEAVALGLSKKGNLVMRAYVQPPSTSKKGFAKHGWRTFMLSRMNSPEITDEIFNEKRPGYKEGPDSGLSVTYVTTDWTNQPKTKKIEKPETKVQPTTTVKPPIEKPEVKGEKPQPQVKPTEPKPTELPQPKPEVKPTKVPEPPKEEPKPTELPQPKPEDKPVQNPEDEEDNNLQENLKRIKSLMLL